MKNIISLIDTNVIINFITKRDDPYKDAVHVNAEYIVTCNAKDFKLGDKELLPQRAA